MNSYVTLLLSAALTVGSVVASSAAPLAKLHAGRTSLYSDPQTKMPSLSDARSDRSIGLTRRVAAGKVEGIKDVPSVSKLRNRNASSRPRRLHAGPSRRKSTCVALRSAASRPGFTRSPRPPTASLPKSPRFPRNTVTAR